MSREMTFGEFQAWLEGYDASITGAPTPEQWAEIKARLATVVLVNGSVGRPLTTSFGTYDSRANSTRAVV